jgi:hypothetical protein
MLCPLLCFTLLGLLFRTQFEGQRTSEEPMRIVESDPEQTSTVKSGKSLRVDVRLLHHCTPAVPLVLEKSLHVGWF